MSSAFLFVPLVAAVSAFGFVLATFASHHFLVVTQSTAAGADEPVWPDEPLFDWFWKVFYLGGVSIVWVGPAMFLARTVDPSGGMLFGVLAVTVFGVLFPIGLLSSLSASSMWIPFTPSLFRRFAQRPKAVLQFYLLSVPVVGAGAWGLSRMAGWIGPPGLVWSVLSGITLAVCWLLYARLIGRFALILSFTDDPTPRRRPPSARPRAARRAEPDEEEAEEVSPLAVTDPWEAPPEPEPDDGPEPYALAADTPSPPAEAARRTIASRTVDDDAEETTYTVEGGVEEPETSEETAEPPVPARPRRRPRRPRRRREDVIKEPATLFERSAFSFLASPGCIQSLITLGVGAVLLSGMVSLMQDLRPA